MNLANWAGVDRPDRVTLSGRYARLEPIDPSRHAAGLLAASRAWGMEDRFRFLFDAPPIDLESFATALAATSASRDPLFFAVIDSRTGRAEGRQALMRIEPAHGVIEVG